MKTTLELPDGLMQRVRFRAVHRTSKRGADLDEFDLGRTWLGASASAHRA